MINSRWAFPLVCLLSALAGAVIFQWFSVKEEPVEPQKALIESPKIKLESVPLMATDGSQTTLGQFSQSIIVINFWAPWCAPCREEIPDLIALQNKHSEYLQVVGLAADSAENVVAFEQEFEMNYPSFLTESLMPLYMTVFENQASVLPFTAILDSKRDLVFSHQGEIRLAELEKALSTLLPSTQAH